LGRWHIALEYAASETTDTKIKLLLGLNNGNNYLDSADDRDSVGEIARIEVGFQSSDGQD
jgi:hypothetical protein